MKISKVIPNNRKKAFEVHTRTTTYDFPYTEVRPRPTKEDKIAQVQVDGEMGKEGFVYILESGEEGACHIDHVLEYNRDPAYAADMLLYKLTLWAQEATKKSPLSTRELIRRLGTSPAQYYRLLDQTNHRKSMKQLLTLLHLLKWDVDVVLKEQAVASGTPSGRVSELAAQA